MTGAKESGDKVVSFICSFITKSKILYHLSTEKQQPSVWWDDSNKVVKILKPCEEVVTA